MPGVTYAATLELWGCLHPEDPNDARNWLIGSGCTLFGVESRSPGRGPREVGAQQRRDRSVHDLAFIDLDLLPSLGERLSRVHDPPPRRSGSGASGRDSATVGAPDGVAWAGDLRPTPPGGGRR